MKEPRGLCRAWKQNRKHLSRTLTQISVIPWPWSDRGVLSLTATTCQAGAPARAKRLKSTSANWLTSNSCGSGLLWLHLLKFRVPEPPRVRTGSTWKFCSAPPRLTVVTTNLGAEREGWGWGYRCISRPPSPLNTHLLSSRPRRPRLRGTVCPAPEGQCATPQPRGRAGI